MFSNDINNIVLVDFYNENYEQSSMKFRDTLDMFVNNNKKYKRQSLFDQYIYGIHAKKSA